MSEKGLRVLITGDDDRARELVAGVIQDAVTNVGFTDVAVLNPAAESIVPPSSDSMLDLVRELRPSLFEQPVRIQASFADVNDKKIDGAFGPEPVGVFFHAPLSGWTETNGDNVAEQEKVILYAAEADREKIKNILAASDSVRHNLEKITKEKVNAILHGAD